MSESRSRVGRVVMGQRKDEIDGVEGVDRQAVVGGQQPGQLAGGKGNGFERLTAHRTPPVDHGDRPRSGQLSACSATGGGPGQIPRILVASAFPR